MIDINTKEAIFEERRELWNGGRCECRRFLMDEHARTMECRDCGRVLDAFGWLLGFARTENGLLRRLEYLQEEQSRRNQSIERLKKEEQRIKARIRAAKDRLLKDAGI